MNKVLIISSFLVLLGLGFVDFPNGAVAALLVSGFSLLVVVVIRQTNKGNDFLINVFLGALILRILFGGMVHFFEWQPFFGGDSLTYDFFGNRLMEIWSGHYTVFSDPLSQRALSTSGPGWGMTYLTAAIYAVFGRNMLAAQSFCGVVGAATAPLVYVCSYKIFQNRRVGKLSALLVALFPAFVIWSSQLLKDGLIIFLLVLIMTMVLQLQQRLSFSSILILLCALFAILALRFYIFYMVAIAVAGSFIVGVGESVKSIVRGFAALILIGSGLIYFGVLRTASDEMEKFGSLERVQISRQDLARSAESGYGEDLDVSTVGGAIGVLPLGFVYLIFAPFPWEVTNFRQAITLPEMLIWWSAMPLLVAGLLYTIKNRLRNSIAILVFTLILTVAYSLFQGNVGTAYRQRAQIQVFLFMFIAVGWTLWQERKENRKIMREERRRRSLRI